MDEIFVKTAEEIGDKIDIIKVWLKEIKNKKADGKKDFNSLIAFDFLNSKYGDTLEYCLLSGLSRLGTELRELAEND